MSLKSSQDWNRFLIRFIIAFAFWEVIAFPLRMLFFSKFYHDPTLQSIFVPIAQIYWLLPIAGEFLGIFVMGVLFTLIRESLPEGLVGGLLFTALFSLLAYVVPVLILIPLTNLGTPTLWWIWVLFLTIQNLIVVSIYSISFSEDREL